MKPYYEDNFATIYHGDCRELLPGLSADVAITDPPYNVGIDYGDGTDDHRGDYADWCRSWFVSLRSTCRAVALTPGIVNVATWCAIEPPKWQLAWLKPACMGRSPLGFNNWEPVLLWGKSLGSGRTDVFTAPVVSNAILEGHPCPKPYRWGTALVSLLAKPGEVVIDPFAGSGTVIVAAKSGGHRCIGIEVEEAYCEIAARRLSQEVLDFGSSA